MTDVTRRTLVAAGAAMGLAASAAAAAGRAPQGVQAGAARRGRVRAARSELETIAAPSNLGLRPPKPGHQPGTWRAPEALCKAGLERALRPSHTVELPRPRYSFEAEAGTRLRNGHAMRAFSKQLAGAVADAVAAGRFPLVLGGDCSILIGCLLGMRRAGPCGLIHIDGHSDFYRLKPDYRGPGSAAGMDLALATGRGDRTMADWGALTPLVADADAVQIGEREDRDPDYAYPEIRQTAILRLDIFELRRRGVDAIAQAAIARMRRRRRDRIWMHIDVDVLDRKVMPAVDSPGSPGIDFGQLARLIRDLRASGRIAGADVSIFNPELDPKGVYAKGLVRCLAAAFGPHSAKAPSIEHPG